MERVARPLVTENDPLWVMALCTTLLGKGWGEGR